MHRRPLSGTWYRRHYSGIGQVNEGFGHDAFSGLAILARETRQILLGTSIINVYSRTPGTLAQHFATIDELSNGRVIAGLGASAPGVVERFHGIPFRRPRTRLREVTELLRLYWQRERFTFAGNGYHLERALQMGARPVQPALPIFHATMAPASVQTTAAVADGWLPAWIPMSRLAPEIAALRSWAEDSGRDASALRVRSPISAVVATDAESVSNARTAAANMIAFFISRNGDLYYRQFCRQGLADEAQSIRAAWDHGGREAAVQQVSSDLIDEFSMAGDPDACLEHLRRQAASGVDIHTVAGLENLDDASCRRILRELVEAE